MKPWECALEAPTKANPSGVREVRASALRAAGVVAEHLDCALFLLFGDTIVPSIGCYIYIYIYSHVGVAFSRSIFSYSAQPWYSTATCLQDQSVFLVLFSWPPRLLWI